MPHIALTGFANPALPKIGFVDEFDVAGPVATTTDGKSWEKWPVGASAFVTPVASGGVAALPNEAGLSRIVVNGELPDGILDVTVAEVGTAQGGIIFRGVDSSNFFQLVARQSSSILRWTLQQVVDGATASTPLATGGSVSANGDRVVIYMYGTRVLITVNGAVCYPWTDYPQFRTGTRHGLFFSNYAAGFKVARIKHSYTAA